MTSQLRLLAHPTASASLRQPQPPGFHARVAASEEQAIDRLCQERFPRCGGWAYRTWAKFKSAYCREHLADGMDAAGARRRFREAAVRYKPQGHDRWTKAHPSDRTLERWWSVLVEAGFIHLEVYGRVRCRIMRVTLPGVLEDHGGMPYHEARAADVLAKNRRASAKLRGAKRAQPTATSPTDTPASSFGQDDYSCVKATSRRFEEASPTTTPKSSQQNIGLRPSNPSHTEPYGVSWPTPGLSHPRPHRPTPKNLHNPPNPNADRPHGLAASGDAHSSPPHLDLPAAEGIVPETEGKTALREPGKPHHAEKPPLPAASAPPDAPPLKSTVSVGVWGDMEMKKQEKAEPAGNVAHPEPVVGIAAAPRVGPVAQTPPESSHEARGEDSDPGRPRYEDINTPARLDAFLDALNAKPPAAKPAPPRPAPSPARRPAPDPRPWESFKDPKYVAGWLAERTGKQAQAPASPPPGPEPRGRVALNMPGLGGSSGAAIDLARGPAAGTSAAQKAAEADMTALWRTSRAAYDALSEMVYRRLPAEEARAKLSPAAWSAAISIKCWRGWLEGVDEFAADAAFEAYRRGVRARGGTVDLPDGVPGDPVAMCEHVRHYCGADAAVVGTDGRSLVTLGLSADDYVAALEESLAAWRAGKVGNGRRLAAHILAVARRLVESPPAG